MKIASDNRVALWLARLLGLLFWLMVGTAFCAFPVFGIMAVNKGVPPQAWFLLAALAILTLIGLKIIAEMRDLFWAIGRGDAFSHHNVSRLRLIGGLLVIVDIFYHAAWLQGYLATGERPKGPTFIVEAAVLVLILAVFTLAEVFRQGVKLKQDSRLTV